MAAHKRTSTERESDLVSVASLHRLRYTQQEIAERLGVSREQVKYDLAALRKRWRQSSLNETDTEAQEILARERGLIRLALDEWERSRLDKGKSSRKVRSATGDNPQQVEETKHKEGRLGDPRYLAIVQTAHKNIREQRGLDAPARTVLSGGVSTGPTELHVTIEEAVPNASPPQADSPVPEATSVPPEPGAV